jgi:hypothetical protein
MKKKVGGKIKKQLRELTWQADIPACVACVLPEHGAHCQIGEVAARAYPTRQGAQAAAGAAHSCPAGHRGAGLQREKLAATTFGAAQTEQALAPAAENRPLPRAPHDTQAEAAGSA